MKVLSILMMFLTLSGTAQNIYFSGGFDVKNGIAGSKAINNKPELDLLLKFGMVSLKKVEVTINYENFSRLDYWRFGFGLGKQIYISDELKIIPTLEYSIINRSDDWGGGLGYKDNPSSHLSLAFSLPIRYEINDSFALETQSNISQRTDINAKYGGNNFVFSNYINFIYKLNL